VDVREGARGEAGAGGAREGPQVERPISQDGFHRVRAGHGSCWQRRLRPTGGICGYAGHPAGSLDHGGAEAPQTLSEGEHDYVDYADGPTVDDNDLSLWAQRSAFSDGELSRMHAHLIALLPAFLLPHLPTSPDRGDLLNALSSGQLICVAYNIGVRQSRKPWGYINDESIPDIVALEVALSASAADGLQAEKGRKGWTFMHTDNLRLWGA